MRIVAIEEHVGRPDMVARVPIAKIAARGWRKPDQVSAALSASARRLIESARDRVHAMDEDGVTQQVVSVVGPGADLLPPAQAPGFAAEYNDHIASLIEQYPDRFGGFAHLPMTAPEAAADELERSVSQLGLCGGMVIGTTDGRFLDDERFDVLLARAAKLDCPLYIHPAPPPDAVRSAYYDNLPGETGSLLAMQGWGWHIETALHVIRLVLSGAFDRNPGLKIIIGHMGECLPMMLARLDDVLSSATSSHLRRSVSQTILDQVWITTSGFYTLPPFLAALTTFGADRMMFAVDYPYSPGGEQVEFLKSLPLSPADIRKIAHENADRLLKLETKAESNARLGDRQ